MSNKDNSWLKQPQSKRQIELVEIHKTIEPNDSIYFYDEDGKTVYSEISSAKVITITPKRKIGKRPLSFTTSLTLKNGYTLVAYYAKGKLQDRKYYNRRRELDNFEEEAASTYFYSGDDSKIKSSWYYENDILKEKIEFNSNAKVVNHLIFDSELLHNGCEKLVAYNKGDKKPKSIEFYDADNELNDYMETNKLTDSMELSCAQTIYWPNGIVKEETHYKHGELHNVYGPAINIYNEKGDLIETQYWENDELVEDKPKKTDVFPLSYDDTMDLYFGDNLDENPNM